MVWFTVVACAATVAIGIIGQTMIPIVGDQTIGVSPVAPGWHVPMPALVAIIAAFIVANYAYQGAQPFYNAMLPELAPLREQGRLSGLGTALGYVGSISGVVLVSGFFSGSIAGIVPIPEGVLRTLRTVIPFTSHAGRVSTFVPTALLFLLFTVPLMIW